MKRIAIAGLAMVAASLASCQTAPIESLTYSQKKALANQLIDRCIAQGVKLESPEMERCAMSEAQREQYVRAANRQRLHDVGEGLQRASENYSRQVAANNARRINCTSYTSGSYTNTNCY